MFNICQNCKKNQATIHLTDIHNNVKKEVHLCETCATEKGFNIKGAASLPQLLGIAAKKGAAASVTQPAKAPVDDPVCPRCGIKWSQFGERGRLGCPGDYQAFDSRLRHLIVNQIAPHVKNQETFHIGKRPGERRQDDELEQSIYSLEKRLHRAVAEENYESASALKSELDALRQRRAAGRAEKANA